MPDRTESADGPEVQSSSRIGSPVLFVNLALCIGCCGILFGMIFGMRSMLALYMTREEALALATPFYVAAVILLVLWAAGIYWSSVRDRKAKRRNAELLSENDKLMHDRDIFDKAIKSILETYRQLTYIDLDSNFMQVVYAPFNPQFQNYSYTDVLKMYTEHGMISKDDVDIFAETLSIENLKKALADDDYLEMKFHVNKKNGSTEASIATVAVIDRIDGVPKSVAFSIRSAEDVLREDRAQRDMLIAAAEQAEAASKAKGEFLSRVSHDMRTPMNAIQGMTALAMINIDDKEFVRDSLSKIDSSSRHMLDMINEVLDMSKIESGRLVLNEEPFDLRELVRAVETMLAVQAQSCGITLRFRCDDVEDYKLVGDAGRLRELLVNIAGNSVKFTDSGGTVALGVQELDRESLGKRAFVFTIADNGVGMDPEFVERMFEPFSRADEALQRNAEGSGLGMSIALNIARLMGGDITVESELGKGSCFKVSLYLEVQGNHGADGGERSTSDAESLLEAIPVEGADVISEYAECDFGGMRALVVDDVEINAEVACELLRTVGVESETAEDGQKAVDAVLSHDPGYFDIVFMDILMPVMDGHDAARRIREVAAEGRPDLDNLPIIAMTANAFADDVRSSREAGMDGHIAKPIDLKLLKGILTEWLS